MKDSASHSVFKASLPASHLRGVVAIGNFDGLHQGHQALLAQARAIAQQKQCPCVVLTFDPHPRYFFQPATAPFLIYDAVTKNDLLATQADHVITLPFDKALSQLSATDFIEIVLHNGLQAQHIVVGQNFVFGHGRQGHVETLMAHGFDVTALTPVTGDNGVIYSSTAVRQELQNGQIDKVTPILGRPWSITGVVIKGDQRGRTLGYPTANIAWPEKIIPPRFGIYVVTMQCADGVLRKGVASFGVRPTFYAETIPLLEVYLFDFDGDLYGQDITIFFHHFLRSEEKFSSTDDLIKQMEQDCLQARTLLR
jgi:riboflavin kinase/FMN adenylyltransferase